MLGRFIFQSLCVPEKKPCPDGSSSVINLQQCHRLISIRNDAIHRVYSGLSSPTLWQLYSGSHWMMTGGGDGSTRPRNNQMSQFLL